ncbi:hypothetical protein ACIBF1_01810 [Spirillospora sp. NPDC050679]
MTRLAFHLAPALMLAYGAVRLIDGRDGQHGPGPAWTVGHLLFLGSLVLYGGVIAGLHGRIWAAGRGAARRAAAGVTAAVAAFGLLTFIRVAIIDIYVGLEAESPAEKSALADRYADVPAVLPQAVYEIGPVFFMLGLVALLAATGHRAASALIALGFVTITLNLDLLPVGAALIWVALVLATREQGSSPLARPRARAAA